MTSVDIVIPWRDSGCEHRRANWEWVQKRYAMLHPSWRIVTGDSDPNEDFVIPAALNDAISRATADVVILAGADSVMSSSALRHVAIHAETEPWVMASDSYVRIDRDQTAAVWAMSPDTNAVPKTHGGSTRSLTQLGWGTLAFRREAFERVWYDERLTAAWEDSQIGAAAALLLGDPFRMVRTVTVLLWHPSARRKHHPDFPNGETLYAQYRRAHHGRNVAAMKQLLLEGGPAWARSTARW